MRGAAREARNWRQLLCIVITGLIVGSGIGGATKLLTPAIVQARAPTIETTKAHGKPARSSMKRYSIDL